MAAISRERPFKTCNRLAKGRHDSLSIELILNSIYNQVLRKKLPVLRPLTEAMDNLTSTRTSSYNASSGNYSFPVPEGAIVLPTAGSHWQLQDIAILHGQLP
eukprot:722594-Hanusia_phi.AAC.3